MEATRLILAACAAWGFVAMSGTVGAQSPAVPTTHTVTIDGLAYAPAQLTVHRGDKVVWINKDPFPHTVTAPGAFDSRSIAANASWTYVARRAGRYDYTCTLHPNMKGTLSVQ